nr:radical SAM protein [Chitinophagales bacterium]
AENGATFAGMTMVRLNGAVAEIFTDWVLKTYPDKAQKILNGIRAVHEGNLNDSRWGKRMKGDGVIADAIHQLYRISKEKYFPLRDTFQFNVNAFCKAGQLQLPFNY